MQTEAQQDLAAEVMVTVHGEDVVLDASGAAFLPAHGVLLVADLHLGKGSAYARSGQLLPPYDTAATLSALGGAIARYRPRRVVALGDSFHDHGAADRFVESERALLQQMGALADWLWIAGNHDPNPPAWLLGGAVTDEDRLGGLVLRHAPRAVLEPGEVAGHLHPCATVSKWGRHVRRRCFVSDGLRLILPSFGAYTGGLDVKEGAIAQLFAGPFHAYLLGSARVYAVAQRRRA